ncbi:hypothetical protein MKZ38_004456 [Zalerion maritima]|uniref:Uncharacterized protein n=1 Tax=Zalerion maritima TaxID=339359 RepID=A0AAD5RYM0_9PEZI|nr:hypothetical protein MKZ38_004456 [Zalerion maritima]
MNSNDSDCLGRSKDRNSGGNGGTPGCSLGNAEVAPSPAVVALPAVANRFFLLEILKRTGRIIQHSISEQASESPPDEKRRARAEHRTAAPADPATGLMPRSRGRGFSIVGFGAEGAFCEAMFYQVSFISSGRKLMVQEEKETNKKKEKKKKKKTNKKKKEDAGASAFRACVWLYGFKRICMVCT